MAPPPVGYGASRLTHPTKKVAPMPHRNLIAALALLAFVPVASHAQDRGYPATALLSAGTSIVGETLRYPTSGPAQVTAAVVVIAPGEKPIVHKHGVPPFASMREGELTADDAPRGTPPYRARGAFMEA